MLTVYAAIATLTFASGFIAGMVHHEAMQGRRGRVRRRMARCNRVNHATVYEGRNLTGEASLIHTFTSGG